MDRERLLTQFHEAMLRIPYLPSDFLGMVVDMSGKAEH